MPYLDLDACWCDPLPEINLGMTSVRLADPAADQERRNREHWIYFLQGSDGGPIKIGRSLKHPLVRASEIQVGYPFGWLRVVGLLRAPAFNEQRIHKQFAHLRLRGEWFRPASDLIEYVRIVNKVAK